MSLAQTITRHYGGEWFGSYGTYPGEGHGRNDRSVSIKDAPNKPDGIVINCHAPGDDWKAEFDRLRRDGLLEPFEPRKSGNDNCRPMFGRRQRQPGVSYFEYQNEHGETVCRKVRTDTADGKTFTWQHPDGRGGWASGRGCDPLPYRLPDLIAAPADAVIYVAEGERKADKLASWGLVATSSKDLPDDLSVFQGRTVAILPDNDPDGAKIANKLESALADIAERAVLVELPGLPPKGDIMDWGGTRGELWALTKAALAQAGPNLLPTLDLAALSKNPARPVSFAIERIAPMGEVTLFTGPGSAGKSLLAQQLCTVSAAAIGTCLGLAVTPGPAIYVTCEDAGDHLHFRQERLCEALGIPMGSLAGKLHLVSLRGELGNELECCDAKGNYSPTAAYHRLAATIKATGSKIVALDNVAHLFAGNENDRHDVTRFVNLLNRLARDTGAAIILVGHPNKSGDTYSGSTAWLNAVRSQVWMDTPRDSDGSVLDRDARVLSVGKANYAPKGDGIAFRWHNWTFVRDEDLPADTRAELAEVVKANGENAAFLRCLASATERQRAVSHNPGSNYAPKVFAAMPEGKNYTTKAFAAAMERLLHLGTIALDQPLWRGPNRVMKQGIKLAENCTDPLAPTPCTNPHETPGNPARFNPPISKDITGAGPDGPPPLGDEEGGE